MKNRILLTLLVLSSLVSCDRSEHVEVLVVGGGAGGVSAGIQCARMGVKNIIVEETPWVGGMLTSAGVSCIDGNYNLRSGIFGEFTDSLAARYGGWDALKTGWVSNINFEPHVAQEILSNIAASCGDLLEVRRETSVTAVSGAPGKWKVELSDASGRRSVIEAEVLVDATELGDVAKMCGVDYRIGMESSADTGESIAPEQSNDIIQDLTYVAVLKDYGPDADMTVERPSSYDPSVFANSCLNPLSTVSETGQTIWPADMMISYGALPGGKYMINWPIYGNDYYVNSIEMTPEQRREAYEKAKEFTMCFVYFIQHELGMKHIGLADDEFPTEDGMPFFPYHRESRRIVGEAFFTMDAAARPYDFNLYRTGIAVGDYPVDHHHFRHPDWKSLPDLHFYPVPSFNVPMGVLIPADTDDLIVTEKSVSVSNLINGATRLQPVVMQLGQAAGAVAALSRIEAKSVKKVGVRQVQEALLDAGCYLMPYLDLPVTDRHFKAVQRIGATGILRGEGRNVGWTNQTWFRTEDPLLASDIHTEGFYDGPLGIKDGQVSIERLIGTVRGLGGSVPFGEPESWWETLGLKDYDAKRAATRLEAAVVIDAAFDPFGMFEVDYQGNIRR
ncbi:MAG: FAD-dependent oxidoreductase [Bacteroidales bacterium]|nr:FAD-dependent oxidoreductase [Bacteroidales bacterium]